MDREFANKSPQGGGIGWGLGAVIRSLPVLCLVGMCLGCMDLKADTSALAPQYSTASVVNAATQTASGFAPNTIATVYGKNLSYTTRGATAAETVGGFLPEDMDGTEIYFAHIRVGLFYISPTQVNFLIPYEILPGTYELQVIRGSIYGPVATVRLDTYAPGFFTYSGALIATHLDGSLISVSAPAKPTEIIVIYAVGLGYTVPDQSSSRIPNRAAALDRTTTLRVSFDGVPADPNDVLYSGITPGCAGLYQINIRLPAGLGLRPNVQITAGNIASPAAVLAAVQQPL